MPLSNKMFGFNTIRKPIVAVSMAPTRSPWGGASPFVLQFEAMMQRRGWRVQYSLQPMPDVVLVIDPRMDHPKKKFGLEELRVFRKAHPQVPILHRINECDQRKGTNDIDELLRQTSELSDHTVFIAEWLRDYFAAKWFDTSRPHSCIYNGADPAVYHPFGTILPKPGEPLRIVTHHWSDNPLKGFDIARFCPEGHWSLAEIHPMALGRTLWSHDRPAARRSSARMPYLSYCLSMGTLWNASCGRSAVRVAAGLP